MRTLKLALLGSALLMIGGPLSAKGPPPPPPPPGPCDTGLTTPDAVACAGYFAGNLLNGSPTDIAKQQAAIASLPGSFTWDGSWSALENSTSPDSVITSLTNGNQLNFATTLFGETIIGAHFGNVYGPDGNVSVFWLFDFGTKGANFVSLDHTEGFSNAALYKTAVPPAVPEPATWAMMLLGFGGLGLSLRRRKPAPQVLQPA